MLKPSGVTKVKVLFLVFIQFNFNSFKSIAAILEKGLLGSLGGVGARWADLCGIGPLKIPLPFGCSRRACAGGVRARRRSAKLIFARGRGGGGAKKKGAILGQSCRNFSGFDGWVGDTHRRWRSLRVLCARKSPGMSRTPR